MRGVTLARSVTGADGFGGFTLTFRDVDATFRDAFGRLRTRGDFSGRARRCVGWLTDDGREESRRRRIGIGIHRFVNQSVIHRVDGRTDARVG